MASRARRRRRLKSSTSRLTAQRYVITGDPASCRRSADHAWRRRGKHEETVMSTQGPDRSVSFEQDIKPLFRSKDRESMTFAFDLWDVSDVRSNADAILARLRAGTMPCDGRWPPAKVELFGRWIATGAYD